MILALKRTFLALKCTILALICTILALKCTILALKCTFLHNFVLKNLTKHGQFKIRFQLSRNNRFNLNFN